MDRNLKIIQRESDIHVIESKLGRIGERNSNLIHPDHETRLQTCARTVETSKKQQTRSENHGTC